MSPERKKLIGGISLTIVLGAIGSGLWSTVLGPIISVSLTAVLNLVTFGIESIKDSTYEEIAKGLYESSSMELLLRVNAIMITVEIFVVVCLIVIRRFLVDVNASSEDEQEKRFLMLMNTPAKIVLKRSSVFWVTIILFCFLVSFHFVETLKMSYANRAVAHFNQSLAICRPYWDDKTEKVLFARFSRIEKSEDYRILMSEVDSTAKANGISLTSFVSW